MMELRTSNSGRSSHTKSLYRSRLTRLMVEVVPALLLIVLPVSVQAGVFSTIADMFDGTVVYEPETNKEIAAHIELLTATNTADPIGAIGGGDLVVDEGALVSTGMIGEDEMSAMRTFTGEISVYVVREGDTLSQIAEMFGVTTNTIRWANDIANGVIQPGDSLVILPIAGVRHVVKSGDTLSTIAKKYEADVDEIVSYNELATGAELSIGETIVVPGGEMAAPVRVAASPVKTSGATRSSVGFTHPAPGAVKTQGIHGYNAVDLAAGYGSPIRAAAAGEVIVSKSSGWNGGYGNYIVIKHPNGVQTLYSHLASTYVGVGAYVGAGETIGGMGSTGRSTGVHLHFEVRGARNPF